MNTANKGSSPQENDGPSYPRSCDDAEDYAAGLEADYEFEAECVRARFKCLLRHLQHMTPRRVLEVGCGLELFIDEVIRAEIKFERWVVVEPASVLAEKARIRATTEPRLQVIEGYCQQPAVSKALREQGLFDVVLLSGVLQDVDEPAELLRVSLSSAAPGAHVLVTTPNALSFHRLLAVEMGLMPTPHALSPRNLRFRQGVVFDPDSLRKLLEQGGLGNLQFEGYMFKPFTHAQMARVIELLPPGVSGGLDRLGQKFPEHGAEIAYWGIKG